MIRIGVENNSPPLSYMDREGNAAGFTRELLAEMEKEGTVRFEVVASSWSWILPQFHEGNLDALANVIETEERRATMAYSIPHAMMHGVSYTRPGSLPITHTSEFAGKSMAMLQGTMSHMNAVKNQGWGAEIVPFPTWQEVLQAVKSGTCDFALMTRPLKFEQPDEMGLRREFVEDVHHQFHIVVHKGDDRQLERINAALAVVRSNGKFDELYAKWIGPIEPHPIRLNDLRPYAVPIGALAALILGVLVYHQRVNRKLRKQAEALKSSNEARARQAELLDRTGRLAKIGGWSVDLQTRKLSWTLETFRIAGIEPPHEPPLEDGINLFAPESRPTIQAAVDAAMESGTPYDLELPIITSKGETRWVQTQGFAEFSDGRVVRIYGTFQDVTARRTTELEIKETNRRFHDLVNTTDGIVWEAEATTFNFTFVSSNAKRILGYALEDWLAVDFWAEHIHPEDRDQAVRFCLEHVRRGENHSFEYRFLAADGRVIWVRDQVVVEMPENGAAGYLRGLMIDITEMKRLELEVALSEARFRAVFDNAPIGISLTTGDHVQLVNAEHERITGVSAANSRDPAVFKEVTHPDDLPLQLAEAEKLLHGSVDHYQIQKRYLHSDGKIQWAELTSRFFSAPDGKERWIVTTLADIGHRKQVQLALQSSEALFRSIFEEAPLGIALMDSTTQKMMRVNAQFAAIAGRSIDEMLAIDWREITHPDDLHIELDFIARLNSGEIKNYQVDKRYLKPDGSYVWINMTLAPAASDDPRHPRYLCMIKNIDGRKRTELQLHQSEERFRRAVLNSPVPILIHAEDGTILLASDSWCEISGYASEELRTMDDWVERAYGDRKASIEEKIELLYGMTGSRAEGDFQVRTKSGEMRLWDFHSAALGQLPDGRRLVISMAMDVTERRTAESELVQTLHEKEALLKEVHHRVKNNLQVIMSLLRLEANKRPDGQAKAALQDMQGRIRSMASLHESLYRTGSYTRINLATYLRQLATELFRGQNTAPDRVRLELELAEVFVSIDQAIPCGLIVNELLANALKHGFPLVRTGKVRLTLEKSEIGEVRLNVSDDGTGLPLGFEIGLTDSLGLRLVSDLTRQLQGTLTTGDQSTFEIRFTPQGPKSERGREPPNIFS